MRKVGAIVRRDLLVNASYRTGFVLDALLGIVNLLIYYYISKAVEQPPAAALGGAPSYFAFAAVGATMTVVIQAASTSLARRVREEQLTGTLETLGAQPVTPQEIACGFAAFPFTFAAVRASVYLLVAGLFLDLGLAAASWPGFLVMMAGAGVALSAIGIALGALTLVLKRAEALGALVTLGLGLAGGAFFPVSVLPAWIRPIAEVLPTRWVFDGMRDALFLGRGWSGDALSLALFSIAALPLALFAFTGAWHRARADGTLGQY